MPVGAVRKGWKCCAEVTKSRRGSHGALDQGDTLGKLNPNPAYVRLELSVGVLPPSSAFIVGVVE